MCGLRFFAILVFTLLSFTLLTLANAQREEYCSSDEETPQKTCLLRTLYIDQEIWNYYAGFFCYNYTNDVRLNFKYSYDSYPILCRNKNATLPIALIGNNPVAFFDHTNETSMRYIRESFKTDALFNNFLTCCREAVDCCMNKMDAENIYNNVTHCPVVWDAWTCFPATKVDTVARKTCSSQAYQSPDHVCRLESEKECIWNGTYNLALWEQQTDYSICAIAPVYHRRHSYHVISLSICIFLCLPAILIFYSFEKLRKTVRVILHRNLLIAICVRNILTSLTKELIILDALKSAVETNHVMENNNVACRVLAFFECAAKNCIYACMIVDGYYLHKVIVRSFSKDIHINYLYAAATGLTILPSIAWAIAKGVTHGDNCWMVDTDGFQWINDGFRIVILSINTVLLLDILRVMLTKMRQGNTSRQTKAAFRATLFLIPLFGLHILVTAKKIVYDDSCRAEDVYEYARYTMEALQGVFVAILFCYANSEVHNEIRNGYRKLTIYLEQKFGWNLRTDKAYRRRTTAATYVQSGTDC